MKKLFFIGLLFLFVWGFGQEICGFDKLLAEQERMHPELLAKRIATEENLHKEGATSVLSRLRKKYVGKQIKTTKGASQTIYEIPVVVHVIVPVNAPIGSEFNPTDEQILTWIEKTNKIYSTTYGDPYYNEGTGGAILPIRLVLAKRNPECNITNGIIRHDLSNLAEYNNNGIKSFGLEGLGLSLDEIKSIAPHWDESKYFNIYIVNKINGNASYNGLMGWAGFPTYTDSKYDSFMKSAIVNAAQDNGYVLSHEMGHALGLYHPFQDRYNANQSNSICPLNDKCLEQGDYVCDTAPTKCLLVGNSYVNPFPTEASENECTGENYDGILYNIMNYVPNPKKFTIGQVDRALSIFLTLHGELVNSPALNSSNMQSLACIPIKLNNTTLVTGVGPTTIKIGTINNSSESYNQYLLFNHYVDYSEKVCNNYSSAYATNLNVGENTLQVGFSGENQNIRAWIDFNNNGVFEEDELIASEDNVFSQFGYNAETLWTKIFNIPDTAVKYQPIRLRIKADNGTIDSDACSALNDGQVEDYMIRIVTTQNYTVDLNCAIQNISTLSGTGTYTDGSLVSISATPKEGYKFLHWAENGIAISSLNNYQFEVHSNRILEAVFQKLYRVNYTAFPNNNIGVATMLSSDSPIATEWHIPDASLKLTASAKVGSYDFLGWVENKKMISNNVNFYIEKINRNYDLVAYFTVKNSPNGNIERREYWFDSDYANKVNTNIFPYDPTVLLNDPIKIIDENMSTNVDSGLHTITYRFQDSLGKWSSAITDFFYKTTHLANAEYWFDNDYLDKQTISGINGDNYVFQNPFVNNLDDKLHTLNFRAQDGSGKWSSTISGYFMLQSQIVGYEYWVNDNYAGKNYTSISPTNILEINQPLTLPNTIAGNNIFYFRAKNNLGKWSSTIATEFNVSVTLGLEDGRNRNNIIVAPNPFEDFLTISSKEQKLSQILLYDISGKLIKEEKPNNTTNYTFHAETLPSGVYMLVVVSDSGKESFKVIKK